MSTRATYEFKFKTWASKTRSLTCYIHHDGYPDGAAAYFYAMLIHPNQQGGAVERFIRANDRAELTTCHGDHGDTDYRYTVNCTRSAHLANCTVEVRHRNRFSNDNYDGLGSWCLRDFIAQHTGLLGESFDPFIDVQLPQSGAAVLNYFTAKHRLEADYGPLSHLRSWSKSKPFGDKTTASANWQNQVRELRAIVDAFPKLASDETARFLRTAEASR